MKHNRHTKKKKSAGRAHEAPCTIQEARHSSEQQLQAPVSVTLQVACLLFPCMGKLLRVKKWCPSPCTQFSWIVQVGLMGHEAKCKMIFDVLSINHSVCLLLYTFWIWRCSGLEHVTVELLCGAVLKTTLLKRNETWLPSDSLQESWHFKWFYS